MDIKSEDVAEIVDIGELNGDKVKMIKTWGGLHVMVGKKDKKSKKPDALAAASHKALAVHQLEKMYGSEFRPSIMKSETCATEEVSDFEVTSEMSKDHLEIQSIKKNNEVEFVVTRFGLVLAKYECEIKKNELNVRGYKKNSKASETLQKNQEDITRSIQKAMSSFIKQNKIGFKI